LEKMILAKRVFLATLCVGLSIGTGFLFWKSGPLAAAWGLGSALCLALGLVITENLVAVFTGVKKANTIAMVFLLSFKLMWWGIIFWAGSRVPPEQKLSLIVGAGVFLLALFAMGLSMAEWPKSIDEKDA